MPGARVTAAVADRDNLPSLAGAGGENGGDRVPRRRELRETEATRTTTRGQLAERLRRCVGGSRNADKSLGAERYTHASAATSPAT